jgi:hypothetical protein
MIKAFNIWTYHLFIAISIIKATEFCSWNHRSRYYWAMSCWCKHYLSFPFNHDIAAEKARLLTSKQPNLISKCICDLRIFNIGYVAKSLLAWSTSFISMLVFEWHNMTDPFQLVCFPFILKLSENMICCQSKYLSEKYISIEM